MNDYEVNLNDLAYHLDRVCGSAPGSAVRIELEMESGGTRAFEDVCAEPSMPFCGLLATDY